MRVTETEMSNPQQRGYNCG